MQPPVKYGATCCCSEKQGCQEQHEQAEPGAEAAAAVASVATWQSASSGLSSTGPAVLCGLRQRKKHLEKGELNPCNQ